MNILVSLFICFLMDMLMKLELFLSYCTTKSSRRDSSIFGLSLMFLVFVIFCNFFVIMNCCLFLSLIVEVIVVICVFVVL